MQIVAYFILPVLLASITALTTIDEASLSAKQALKSRCSSKAAILVADGTMFYSDPPAFSHVNDRALKDHLQKIEPLRHFVETLVGEIESGDKVCARQSLKSWADAGALLGEPRSFSGIRERQRFVFAINMAALRLRQHEALDPDVLTWIQRLNSKVVQDFEPRNRADNLNAWSGATAAVGYLLTGDQELGEYARAVSLKSAAAVQDDGTITAEMQRGARSMLYHAYHLSAWLTIDAAGLVADPTVGAALERMYNAVRTGTCTDSHPPFEGQARIAQSPVTAEDVAAIKALAVPYGWSLCSQWRVRKSDPLRGGNLQLAAEALRTASVSSQQ